MHRAGLLTLPLLPAVLAYGYGGGSSKEDSTPAAAASSSTPSSSVDGVHIVKVGQNGLNFDPAEISAEVGDTVEFHFWPQAHSVAQSSFDEPCQPLNDTGFFSGAVPVEDGRGDEVWSFTVEDEDPKWFYCATGRHCQSGMVGVINPPSNGQRTLQQFAAAASSASENVEPSATSGGTLGAPAAESSEASAGVEIKGDIRWGMMSLGIAMVGVFGGMLL